MQINAVQYMELAKHVDQCKPDCLLSAEQTTVKKQFSAIPQITNAICCIAWQLNELKCIIFEGQCNQISFNASVRHFLGSLDALILSTACDNHIIMSGPNLIKLLVSRVKKKALGCFSSKKNENHILTEHASPKPWGEVP